MFLANDIYMTKKYLKNILQQFLKLQFIFIKIIKPKA